MCTDHDGSNSSPPPESIQCFAVAADDLMSYLDTCDDSSLLTSITQVKRLVSVSANAGFEETRAHIIPYLSAIAVHPEALVRLTLIEQLGPLACFCCNAGGDDDYLIVINRILPVIQFSLADANADIRITACSAFLTVSQLMNAADLESRILSAILNLSIEMDAEEKRITAVELLTTLASTFGADLCRRSVVPTVSLLSADPSVDVRKSIALNLHKVYKAIRRDSLSRSRSRSRALPSPRPNSESSGIESDNSSAATTNDSRDYYGPNEMEASNMLISVVIRLSNDPEPFVRMASAESMVEISNAGGRALAGGPFLGPYSRLLDDPSETVKSVAMKQVGFFISSLPSSQIDEKLLHHYTDLVNDSLFPMGYDSELCYHCAYTFPGVFQAVGGDRWSELREVYLALANSNEISVRQTLACSLHIVAQIMCAAPSTIEREAISGVTGADVMRRIDGVIMVEDELIPVFEAFLQDVGVVQMGALKNIAAFLGCISKGTATTYLMIMPNMLRLFNPFNWRLRESIATQLHALLLIPPPEMLFKATFTLALTLLQDTVATVRQAALPGMAKLLLLLYEMSEGSVDGDWTEDDIDRALAEERSSFSQSLARKESELTMSAPASAPQSPSRPSSPLRSVSSKGTMDILTDDGGTTSDECSSDENDSGKSQRDPGQGKRCAIKCSALVSKAVLASRDLSVAIRVLNMLVTEMSSRYRILWAELSLVLLRELPRDLFENYFLDGLLFLTSDPVSNVRVAVGAVLSGWSSDDKAPFQNTASPWTWLLRRPDVRECVKRLSRDDNDVYIKMQKLQPLFPDLTFTAISCKGLKEAPGGSEPVLNAVTGALFGYSSRRSSLTCVSSLKDSSSCGSTTVDVGEDVDKETDSDGDSDGASEKDTSRSPDNDLELGLRPEQVEKEKEAMKEGEERERDRSSSNEKQAMSWGGLMEMEALTGLTASGERQSQIMLDSGREVIVAV